MKVFLVCWILNSVSILWQLRKTNSQTPNASLDALTGFIHTGLRHFFRIISIWAAGLALLMGIGMILMVKIGHHHVGIPMAFLAGFAVTFLSVALGVWILKRNHYCNADRLIPAVFIWVALTVMGALFLAATAFMADPIHPVHTFISTKAATITQATQLSLHTVMNHQLLKHLSYMGLSFLLGMAGFGVLLFVCAHAFSMGALVARGAVAQQSLDIDPIDLRNPASVAHWVASLTLVVFKGGYQFLLSIIFTVFVSVCLGALAYHSAIDLVAWHYIKLPMMVLACVLIPHFILSMIPETIISRRNTLTRLYFVAILSAVLLFNLKIGYPFISPRMTDFLLLSVGMGTMLLTGIILIVRWFKNWKSSTLIHFWLKGILGVSVVLAFILTSITLFFAAGFAHAAIHLNSMHWIYFASLTPIILLALAYASLENRLDHQIKTVSAEQALAVGLSQTSEPDSDENTAVSALAYQSAIWITLSFGVFVIVHTASIWISAVSSNDTVYFEGKLLAKAAMEIQSFEIESVHQLSASAMMKVLNLCFTNPSICIGIFCGFIFMLLSMVAVLITMHLSNQKMIKISNQQHQADPGIETGTRLPDYSQVMSSGLKTALWASCGVTIWVVLSWALSGIGIGISGIFGQWIGAWFFLITVGGVLGVMGIFWSLQDNDDSQTTLSETGISRTWKAFASYALDALCDAMGLILIVSLLLIALFGHFLVVLDGLL